MTDQPREKVGPSLADFVKRLSTRAIIALGSDSQYDEFVIVENDADASALVLICNEYQKLVNTHATLVSALKRLVEYGSDGRTITVRQMTDALDDARAALAHAAPAASGAL